MKNRILMCGGMLAVGLALAAMPARAWNTVVEDQDFEGQVVMGQAVQMRGPTSISGALQITGGCYLNGAWLAKTNFAALPLRPGTFIIGAANSNAVAVTLSGDGTINSNGVFSTVGQTYALTNVPTAGVTNIWLFSNGLFKAKSP